MTNVIRRGVHLYCFFLNCQNVNHLLLNWLFSHRIFYAEKLLWSFGRFWKNGLKLLICYVLMTGLFHVWACRHSKIVHSIFYLPNNLGSKLHCSEQWYKWQQIARLYLVSSFKYVRWRCWVGVPTILIMILVHVCVRDIALAKWKDLRIEAHVNYGFQPRSPWKLFKKFRMFWEDSSS